MKKCLKIEIVVVLFLWVFSQSNLFPQAQNVGIGTTTPDNSAILELYSTSHGFLVPRLTTTQRNAISNPATGLLIYNLDNQRFEYYNGAQWIGVVSSIATVPFSLISTGTNTNATMTVGSGASIVLGGGNIEANIFKGNGSTTDAVDLGTAEVSGVLPVARGGTGNSTTPGQGQLLIGNGTGFSLNQLTAGTGITITNGAGTITIADANAGTEVNGSGSPGQVSFWNSTNSISGDNNLWWDNTNKRLGLGLTTPSVLFHQDQGTGNSTYHKFTAGSTTGTSVNDGFDIGIDNSGNAIIKQNESLPLIFQTNGTERMRLLANGKLGIGTTSIVDDSILVQTNGDVYIDGDLIVTGNIDPKVVYFQPLNFTPTVVSKGALYYDNNNDILRVYNGSSWSSLVTQNSLQNEVASVAWKTTGNSGLNETTNFIGTTDYVGFKIKTNNTDRMVVTGSGNVGIGTSSPNSTFSVEGSVSNKVTVVTTSVTLDETYHTILANTTSNLTINLPNPSSSNVGRIYVIKNINTGYVSIAGSIEGTSTTIFIRQRESIELVSNGSTWVVTNSYQPVPPIGSIIAWHKDFSNTPSLPYGWVECNGQTLNDPASPYHNQVIPNLNGDPNGANSPGLNEKAKMFLRGGTTSGIGQNDAFQGHKHSVDPDGALKYQYQYSSYNIETGGNYGVVANIAVGNPISDGTNGTPRTADETRPKNMSVVWIMRVK